MVLQCYFSTDFDIETHFGLAKLSTSISPNIVQFQMESIFKMASLHLSIRTSEPCVFVISKLSIFKIWILTEDYIWINDTFGFFDSLSISSEIELGLGPSRSKISFIIFHSFLRILPIPLKLRVDIFW
jgi:hypothetical protein